MKRIFIVTSCLLSLFARAQHNTTIHATLKGLEAGQWVYWSSIMNSLQKDSVQTVAGGFTINTDIPEGDAYMLRIGSKYAENSVLLLYLEKGKVDIKGDGPLFKDAKARGEACLLEYDAYRDMIAADPVLKDRAEVYKKANELYAKKDSTGLAAMQPQLDRMDSVDKALTRQWIAAHRSSSVSAFLLSRQLGQLPIEEKEKIYNTLMASAKNNAPARRIAASIRINNLTGIGKTAMDFTQNDTLGRAVSLKDFRGKYVLVDFWASWCVPCRGENPNVVAAFNKYKDKNFTVLGVSLDQPTGKEKWLKAIHDDHLTWTHVSDLKFWNNAVARQYDINSIPANLLLDPGGKIIAKDLHGEELEKKLAQLLSQHAFSLNGQVSGSPAPARINFYYTDDKGANVHDSARVVGGKFSFHGNIDVPTMGYLTGASADRDEAHSVTFFLEPAAMSITLPAGDYRKAVVSGSKSQEEYEELERAKEPIQKEMEPLSKAYAKAGAAMNAAVRAGKPQDVIDTLRYRAAAIHDQFEPYFGRMAHEDYAFFASHPQSYVTAFQLRFHTGSLPLDSLKLFYDHLGPVQQSSAGKEIAAEIGKLQAGSPGSMAKDFSVTELNGSQLSLSSLKGKYVLIDFWASWCVPCRKSMPHVKDLYARYKDKGLEVIGVSDDDRDSTAWKKAVEKDGTGIWHNVLRGLDWDKIRKHEKNERDISEKFGIHSLPTKILIDKEGKIIGRYDKGSEEEAEQLDRLLAQVLG